MTDESELTDGQESGSMIGSGAAALLAQYALKPPQVKLTREDQRSLRSFVIQNKSFRKLKDLVRMEAMERQLQMMNLSPHGADFHIQFAEKKGFREGMLHAIQMMESAVGNPVEEEDDS